jgi:RNA polymerase sigma factor (sigma-70 family)
MHENMKETRIGGADRRFPATSMALLKSARRAASPQQKEALERLVHLYWKPVYCCIRYGWKKSNEDSKDLTQAFFVRLLDEETLEQFAPERGSFRAFLKAVLANFLRKEERSAATQKRGGDAVVVGLDISDVEAAGLVPDAGGLAPEEVFGLAWKRSVLQQAVERLERTLQDNDRRILMEVFRKYDLEPERPDLSYRQLADQLGLTESAVRRYLWKARQEFRKAVSEVIAETVDNEGDFTVEMKEFYGEARG